MESSTHNRARFLERVLFYGWVPVFVLALWPYTINPCEPPKLVVTAILALCCAVLAFFGRGTTGGGEVPAFAGKTGAPGGAGVRGLLVLWLGWQAVSGLCSPLPGNSLWSLALPAAWVLVALAARRAFAGSDNAWRLVAVIVASLCAASLYGFAQHLGWDSFPWSSTDTVEYRGLPSTFGNPNFAGHALVPGILLALALATRPRFRIPALAAALVMATHLWFTGMRGGPVALAAAAVLFGAWWLSGRILGMHSTHSLPTLPEECGTGAPACRPDTLAGHPLGSLSQDDSRGRLSHMSDALLSRISTRCGLTLTLTVLMGLVMTVAALSAYRATHATWVPVSDSSLVLRYNSAHGAARMILDHPLTGVGPGNYALLVAEWWTPFEQRWYSLRGLKNDHVHCEFLEAGAEGGFPGLFLHVLLFSWVVLAALRLAGGAATPSLRRLGLALALCAFAMGVDGLFGFNLHVPVSAGLFFMLLGMLDGLAGGDLAPAPVHRQLPAFAGRVCVAALALIVLIGAVGRFRADAAVLRGQGMQEQLDSMPSGGAESQRLQNTRFQELMIDRGEFPADSRFAESMGSVCLAAGHFGAAEEAYADALAKYPADPDAFANLAQALHGQAAAASERGDRPGAAFLLQRAEAAAERSRDLCPPLAAPHDALWRIAELRADMARQLGMDDKAQERRAVEEAHAALQYGVADAAPVYCALARAALRAERCDEAADHIGSALDRAPASPDAWAVVEALHQKVQDSPPLLDAVARAYGSLKKSQPGTPGFLSAAWWLTHLYSTCPGMPVAVAHDALHAAPAEPGAWGLLAETPEGQAHLTELVCSERTRLLAEVPGLSIPALVDALCADPPPSAAVLVEAAEMLANHAVLLGGSNPKSRVKREFVWAAPLLKNAAAKCGATPADTARIVAACARLYGAAEMWTETEAACAEALPSAEPEARVELHLLRSRALVQLSRRDEALAAAREAVQTAPGRWDVQWNLAQRLSEAGMDREAQFLYRMLLQRVPGNAPEYRRVAEEYGRVLQRLQTSASGVAP